MNTTPTASPELPDLAACPFCGGTEAFVERADYSAAFVVCDSRVDEHSVCMARGPIGIQDDDGEEIPGQAAAIRKWNKAAALARRAQPEGEAPQAELSQVAALLYSALNDAYQASMFDDEELKRVVRALSAYNRYRSSPAATLSPLCGAQHAESGKEESTMQGVIALLLEIENCPDDGEPCVIAGKARLMLEALAAQQAAAPGKAADAEEAAKLQTLLMTEFSCYRVASGGLFAWAMNALLDNSPHRAPSAPRTPEAPKDERKGIELWRATLRACGELPEGYEVRIELENGCGMAVWYDAEGERHVIDGDGYLSDDVNEAVDAAIQRAAALKGGA